MSWLEKVKKYVKEYSEEKNRLRYHNNKNIVDDDNKTKNQQFYLKNKDKFKKYYEANKDIIKEKNRLRYINKKNKVNDQTN